MSSWEGVEFLASGQEEPLTCGWHPFSQLKGKQRCLDARAPPLLVARDTSALPQGRNPATTLLTPHSQAGPPASPSGKGRSPLPWAQAGTCSPLRLPRACMSNPETMRWERLGKLDR